MIKYTNQNHDRSYMCLNDIKGISSTNECSIDLVGSGINLITYIQYVHCTS